MASPSDIRLQVSVNGGAQQQGAITVAFANELVLSLAQPAGVRKAVYRIWEYPDGFACPAGWSTTSGIAYEVTTLNGSAAPAFDMPDGTDPDTWGKYFFSVRVNDQLRDGAVVSDLFDDRTAAAIPSITGIEDVGYLEANQFDTQRRYISSIKGALRQFDANAGGAGVTNHNALSNLTTGDVHTQYELAARAPVAYTGATNTTVLTDVRKYITTSHSAANALTIPPNASVAYPTETLLGGINIGAGAMTLTQGAGVTLSGPNLIVPSGAWWWAKKTATNTWQVTVASTAVLGGFTYNYTFSATTSGDPGPGGVRFGHATPASATQVFIDDLDQDGGDVRAFWLSLVSTTTARRALLKIGDRNDPLVWHLFEATAVGGGGGSFATFTVTYVDGQGAMPTGVAGRTYISACGVTGPPSFGTQALAAGSAAFAQPVSTGASTSGFAFTGGAHTTLNASTEYNDILLSLARTVQFATGAMSEQRACRITAPTYGFVGASTITHAATLAISGAPVAGTNATLTNSYALWIEAGVVRIGAMGAGLVKASAAGVLSSGVLEANNYVASPSMQRTHRAGTATTASTSLATVLTIDTSGFGSQASGIVEVVTTKVDVIGQAAATHSFSFTRQGGTLAVSALTLNGGSSPVTAQASGNNILVQVTPPDSVSSRWEMFATITHANTVA